MPIYEYVCCECGHQFECLVRGDEQPTCPSCGRGRLAKQLSAPVAHSAGAAVSCCPVRELGACQTARCGDGRCDLAKWG